jgi:hypothetical protein
MDGSDPLVASPLATWSIQLLDSYLTSLRIHEISWISRHASSTMDGSDPLVASPLATWSIQLLDSYLTSLRVHEISWISRHAVLNYGRLRSSRGLATHATWSIQLWALTLRTSELRDPLDLCHLSSLDGRLGSSRGFATRDLEHPNFGLLPREPPR